MSFSSLRMSIYVLLGSLVLSLVGSQVWALTMADTSYVDFQANNCMIPAGRNMCPSTLYVTTYAGRAFNVTNLNRGLTTQNLLTPNNYTTIPGSTNSTYTVGTNITGDAANYISYGDSNNLNLFEGTRLIARAITSAKCASGTIWNGKICSTPGIVSPIVCTMETRLCPTNVVMPRNMNTCEWLPDQCGGLNPIDPLPPTIVSRITLKSGNWDTVFTDSLYSNISKNYYLPEQVIKNITIPTTTSILNVTLSSSKAQCVVSPSYKTDRGIIFSNNWKIVNKIDLPSFTMSIPAYWVASQIWDTLYGKISTITISCETSIESTKDLLIYAINSSSTVPSTPISFQASNCTIPVWASVCPSTLFVTAPAGKFYSVRNFTRGITTSNLLNPNNYTNIPGSINLAYTVSTHPAWAVANYATNWVNDLALYEGESSIALAKTAVTAMCASGSTWNGQFCTESQSTTCNNPGTIPVCADGTPMERDSLTCQWLSLKCVSAPTLAQVTIWSTTDQYNWWEIIIEQWSSVILKGRGKAGSMVYLSREWSPFTLSAGISSIWGEWSLSSTDPAFSTIVLPGAYTYILSSTPPPSIGISPGGSLYGSRIRITLRSPNILPPVTAKPILELFRTPKYLAKGQSMNLTVKTNATNLSYYCTGNGPVANKRVPINPNQSLYTSTWEALTKEGWSGTYECEFTAIGAWGQVSVSDSFTIAPDTTTPPPTTTPYTDFQANNCIIQANKSTCASSIFVRATPGKYFDVTNSTRWLTTSNLLNPRTYITVIGSTTPLYTVTTHVTGDAANYLKFGTNDLQLKEGATELAKAVATAACVKGTIWNGQMCSSDWGIACTDVVKLCEDGSIMPRDPNCGWLPGQCGGEVAEPLAISCSKSAYNVWERISCKISGWMESKSCWQLGTKNTEPTACTNLGWKEESGSLYYLSTVSTSIVGEYALYVKDSRWAIAATKVSYTNPMIYPPISSPINFEANNCYIPAGQNKCASILYVRAPKWKTYSVWNLTRGITTSNLLNPNNYTVLPGSTTSIYTVWANARWDAANYITYGESNTLTLLEWTTIVARAIASAKCIAGTTWAGKICSTNGWTDPIYCTMEARMCEDGSTMPRDTKSCAWLPDQCPTELNPVNPINPVKPFGNPTINIVNIWWTNPGNWYVEITKSPTSLLSMKWDITSVRQGLTIKVSTNTSDFFIMMPLNQYWEWSTENSPTSNTYKSRIVVEGNNLLTFSLIEDATNKQLAQSFVKVKVKFARGGGIIEPPLCMMASGTFSPCVSPPTPICTSYRSKIGSTSSMVYYCPTDDATEINPINTINPKLPVTKPPVVGTGVMVPLEQPIIPPCRSTSRNSLTIGCDDSVNVVIVEGSPTTPIEEALDAASRKRIDTIIARTRSRVADMSTSDALTFIDSSIRRIQSLPNKTTKAKLIDTYTLSRLQWLRASVNSSASWAGDDYIGLVDNVLSNSY